MSIFLPKAATQEKKVGTTGDGYLTVPAYGRARSRELFVANWAPRATRRGLGTNETLRYVCCGLWAMHTRGCWDGGPLLDGVYTDSCGIRE